MKEGMKFHEEIRETVHERTLDTRIFLTALPPEFAWRDTSAGKRSTL